MRIFKIVLIMIATLFIYVILIRMSIIGFGFIDKISYYNYSNDIENENVVVGVGQSVEVTITRDRWYGKIIENNGDKRLYLFYSIPIPIIINNSSYVILHIAFLIFYILL